MDYLATARSILPVKIVPVNKVCNPARLFIESRESRPARLLIDRCHAHPYVCTFEQTNLRLRVILTPKIVGKSRVERWGLGSFCP